MKLSTSTKYLFIIFLIAFILFFPSLRVFFTNDDFFLLKIAQANSVKEFLNFFNLTGGPDGLGMYRPLTTQVFYFLAWKIFNLDPIGLHVISFLVFFAVVYLVYKLSRMLFTIHKSPITNHVSLLAAFLYATSASHFGHLYYLAAFQELGMAFFFLLSTISFVNFLTKGKYKHLVMSILYFVFSLLSKETAVVLPFVLVLIWGFYTFSRVKLISLKKFVVSLAPYFLLLSIYLYMRLAHYGFAQGESYIWDFSVRRAVNTLGWYGLWSLNLPEMLVDYVGPGLKFNPNLFKFWSKEIIPIFVLFGLQLVLLFYAFLKSNIFSFKQKKLTINYYSLSITAFCAVWFVLTLLPVLFLPLHKFTFYLTLPLIGVSIIFAYLLSTNYKLLTPFLMIWLFVSVSTLNLTSKTHWITQGAKTAKNVYEFFQVNTEKYKGKTIAFYDTQDDSSLPWSPTQTVKVVISGNNFFKVFFPQTLLAENESGYPEAEKIKSRQFLGY